MTNYSHPEGLPMWKIKDWYLSRADSIGNIPKIVLDKQRADKLSTKDENDLTLEEDRFLADYFIEQYKDNEEEYNWMNEV